MNARPLITFLMTIFGIVTALPQVTITGNAEDADKQPLPGTVVRIYSEGRIKAFASANSKGEFSLKVPALAADSLDVTAQCISYDKVTLRIANRQQHLSVTLHPAENKLKEVTVAAPMINERGDTLVYRLASFLGKSDVSLEDGLKKLPGINVSGNGQISYLGKSISNFYIEGMNMLGGKYNLATRNMPAKYVKNVEVLNNHHDALVDKGKPSDDVALNVTLDNSVRFKPVGTSEMLVGYGDEWLYRIGVTGMMFTPQFQTIVSAKAGNDRQFAIADAYDHITIPGADNESLASQALGSLSGSRPPLKGYRYISPDDRLVNASFMRKFTDVSSLKANATYAYSATDYSYSQFSRYYAGEEIVTFNEAISPYSRTHRPSLDVTYNHNSASRYVDNRFSARADFLTERISTIEDNRDINQLRKARTVNLSNSFSWRINRGPMQWNLSSSLRYRIAPEADLNVALQNSDDNDTEATQHLSSNRLEFSANASTAYNRRRSTMYLPLSVKYSRSRLKSDLVGTSHLNDITGNFGNLSLSPSYQYVAPARKVELDLHMTLRMMVMHARNHATGSKIGYDRPLFDPSMRLKYNISGNSSLTVNSSLNHSIGDVLDLMTAPVMTSYRTNRAASGLLARSRTFSSGFRFEFKKPMDFWFFNASANYSDAKRNLMSSQIVDSSDIATSAIAADNSSQSLSTSASVTKQIIHIGAKITLSGNYSWSRNKMMQQNRPIPYYGQSYSISADITLAPWRLIEIRYYGNYSKSFSHYLSSHSSFDMMSHDIKLSLYPLDGMELFGQTELLRKQITADEHKSISLFDLGISYKLKQFKFTLRADNILDTRNYYYTVYSALDTYSYSYRLRQRSFTFSVTFTR